MGTYDTKGGGPISNPMYDDFGHEPTATEEEWFDLVFEERKRQVRKALGGDTNEFDKTNSQNDWIAYITAYLGRASQRVFRNERENQTFDENLIKVAALCLATFEARKNGFC